MTRPDTVALVEGARRIRYPQLAAAARQAAAGLADAGVRPGDLVPVVLPRGVELVTTLLGIARLGAGAAALDPRWPARRLDEIRSMLAAAEPGEAVASVFFTSGSTGRPKGIPVTWRALTGLLRPGGMPLRLDADTVMAVAAPAQWDAFALELWGPLLNGGTCVLTEGEHLTPDRLRRYVAECGLNTVWLTASLFNLFVEEDVGAFAGVDQVAAGGEKLSPDHVRELLGAHPGIRLFNGYGPAENCVFSTMHPVSVEDCALPSGIPIGRPVGGTAVHILDGDRRCAPGEVGEICLAGPRLSPGYLGEPELTRRAFVTTELDGRPTRVYRTGDLGRCDERGTFHFHGRADRQLKVRGHRIEPDEIERHVTAHPAVSQCVVVSEGTELIACYRAARPVPGAELREFLHARLPGYLVPDRWLPVDHFPLLHNGKTDVHTLRTRVTPVPDDNLHTALAGLVRDVASVGPVSAGESLTAAGVNSLQLIRLCLRVSRRFGVHVDSAALLTEPTLAHLAELVRAASPAARASGSMLPLTAVQTALLLTEVVNTANRSAWHCTLLWRIEGALDVPTLRRAVGVVHRRHPTLHARYLTKPFLMAGTEPPTEPEFTVLTGEASIDEALDAPFALDRGPAWRVVLAQDRALLGVAVHHVAFDGWSEHLIARDLAAAYAGAGWCAEPLPWPVTEIDADVARQREALAERLAGTPALNLPRGLAGGDRSGRVVREFDAPATLPFVAGLAAYAAAVQRLTGATDFPVAVPVTRRGPADEDTIGCLLSLLCLRLQLDDDTRQAAIDGAGDAMQAALRTRDVPFTEAVGLLRPPVAPNLFVLQENPAPVLSLPGCHTAVSRRAPRHAGFEFQVELSPGEVAVTFRPEAVDPGFVKVFADEVVAFVVGVS